MKETNILVKTPRPIRKKKFISKSLDNKQKNNTKNLRKQRLINETLNELRNSFYGKRIEDPIEIESTKSENLQYVKYHIF